MAKKEKELAKSEEKLHVELIKQMLTLATAGFGLVAALAWNDTIKTLIDEWIKPYVSRGSGLTSEAIYAIIATVLAVLVTYYLTKLLHKFERK